LKLRVKREDAAYNNELISIVECCAEIQYYIALQLFTEISRTCGPTKISHSFSTADVYHVLVSMLLEGCLSLSLWKPVKLAGAVPTRFVSLLYYLAVVVRRMARAAILHPRTTCLLSQRPQPSDHRPTTPPSHTGVDAESWDGVVCSSEKSNIRHSAPYGRQHI